MTKKRFTVPYFAILALTFLVLVAGIVVTAVLGINLGFKEAGGTKISVDLNSAISSEAKAVVEDVLADKKVCIDSIVIEDKETTSYLVVNIADKSIENIDEIKLLIASKLKIEATSVTSTVVKSTIKNDIYLAIGLVLVGLIIAVMLFGLYRYRVAGGLTLGFAFLLQIMLPLSIILCTRLQLTLNGIVAIVVMAMITALFACIMLEKYRAQTRGKDLSDGDEQAIMSGVIKSTFEPLLFVIIGILIPSVFMLFIGVNSVLVLIVTILISLACMLFSLLVILPRTNIALSEIARIRFEAYLSKNNSPAPAKKKSKK